VTLRLAGPAEGPIPVAINGTLVGDPGASELTLNAAERPPSTLGVTVICAVHDAPGGSGTPQLLTCAKSLAFVPVIEKPLKLTVVEPEFVMVTGTGAEVKPTAVDGKVMPEELICKLPVEVADPVALNATAAELAPLALTQRYALLSPAVIGVALTSTTQLAPEVSAGVQLSTSEKSPELEPAIAMLFTVSVLALWFVTVTVCAVEVNPVVSVPKLIEDDETVNPAGYVRLTTIFCGVLAGTG